MNRKNILSPLNSYWLQERRTWLLGEGLLKVFNPPSIFVEELEEVCRNALRKEEEGALVARNRKASSEVKHDKRGEKKM